MVELLLRENPHLMKKEEFRKYIVLGFNVKYLKSC